MSRKVWNKKKRGFTLIELIIVIAIIAILMAILIPNMVTYINEANNAVGDANARTVYSAASAAVAAALSDKTIQGVGDITNHTVQPVTGSPTTFTAYVDSLLGKNFTGVYSVKLTSDKTAVESVSWNTGETGAAAHPYPKASATT